jgi:Fic family protein
MQIPSTDILLPKIDVLMTEIGSMRPLSKWELVELEKSLRIMEVYNSNAIEGNTLSLGETKLVIEDGITIGGKTVREMYEAENLSRAISEVTRGKQILDEETILTLHAMIMRNIDNENAGIYRRTQVYISWDDVKPPKVSEVSKLMRELLEWYSSHPSLDKGRLGGVLPEKSHPVLIASEFHYRFVKIHPFTDGNGRTARLLVNLILMSIWYPMIIVPVVRRMDYISSLHSLTGSLDRFQDFYADIVHENLRDYIRMVSP